MRLRARALQHDRTFRFGVSALVALPEAAWVGTVGRVTELLSPSRTARLVVGVLASMALLVGAFVLALVAFLALFVGAPAWSVAAAVGAVVVGLFAASQRVRRAAARQ